MPLDPEIRAENRAATHRIRALADRLTDDELRHPVGEHWTVSILFAHLAFWERRALDGLERESTPGAAPMPEVDVVVNDLSLPLWAAVPPREAARLAIEWAEAMDAHTEALPDDVVAKVLAEHPRWIRRSLHRDEHLDEADEALRG